ncbi:type II toxin-antitoxin system RelE/ParE family toxin [Comamonas sp. HJ-2]|jgi:proteic killer suppression protein
MAIQTFKCKATAELFHTGKSVKFAAIAKPAMLRLGFLDGATALHDLKLPPSNKLHPMTKEKERIGQHAIRINDKFRICFIWGVSGPEEVEIVDYH